MSKYIDLDKLLERWNNMSVRGRTEFDQEIMVAPTIDIVRCKECMHKYVTGDTTQYYVCDFMDAQYDENGYCHHGEVIDNE